MREINDVLSLAIGSSGVVLLASSLDTGHLNSYIVFYSLVTVMFTGFIHLVANQLTVLEYENISFYIALICLLSILISFITYWFQPLLNDEKELYLFLVYFTLLVNAIYMIRNKNSSE